MLNHVACLPVTMEIADRAAALCAAALCRERGWKLPDAFQTALAQEQGLSLSTRNSRDFDTDRHPFVTVPYTLRGHGRPPPFSDRFLQPNRSLTNSPEEVVTPSQWSPLHIENRKGTDPWGTRP